MTDTSRVELKVSVYSSTIRTRLWTSQNCYDNRATLSNHLSHDLTLLLPREQFIVPACNPHKRAGGRIRILVTIPQEIRQLT